MALRVILSTVLLVLGVRLAASAPTESSEVPKPTEVGDLCGTYDGQFLGDCADPLTCIPLSSNCTFFRDPQSLTPGCPGTCQELDVAQQKVYTLCGGWHLYDDCDERIERCSVDPRNRGCGPPCDGPGICIPYEDTCRQGQKCREGTVCFEKTGACLPLRFGSDSYEKTSREQVWGDDDEIQRPPWTIKNP
ncbi:hypothetical protein VTJ83DRAFT_7503 [Remersonia thermophila]|uniref:Uncharacterized protein n=1 Tax=Remersonia thermophila TaxID=72144 RepID=A0ABR4D3T2_9PEZI